MSDMKILALKLWHFHRVQTSLKRADIIIGLGSYDLRVAVHCAQLLQRKMAPRIVFTGKDGNWTRGRWQKTEAEVFADKATECGVSSELVLCEKRATNISENIRFTKDLIGSGEIRSAIVVTKPNTMRRALVTAQFVWPEVDMMIDSPNLAFDEVPAEGRTWEDLTNEMVGDLQRLRVYGEKGFHLPVDIPTDVWNAFEILKDSGFNQHLLK